MQIFALGTEVTAQEPPTLLFAIPQEQLHWEDVAISEQDPEPFLQQGQASAHQRREGSQATVLTTLGPFEARQCDASTAGI